MMMRKFIFVLCAAFLIISCSPTKRPHSIQGTTMGTYYQVIYFGEPAPTLQKELDSLLVDFNKTFSVFDTASLISFVNRSETAVVNADFCHVFNASKHIYDITGGAFDPTIEPLVRLWGFSRDTVATVSSDAVDSMLAFLGFDRIRLNGDTIRKEDGRMVLNFNAIAKGFAVDKVSEFMKQKGYADFLVEIGGEIVTSGTKDGDTPWIVGIQVPTEDKDGEVASDYSFPLANAAVATSGNYRNYREENGVRYSHIISPKTGYPEKSDLLSVTVVAPDCVTADALATAFMVLGIDSSMEILRQHEEWAAYFIYLSDNSFKTCCTENFPR